MSHNQMHEYDGTSKTGESHQCAYCSPVDGWQCRRLLYSKGQSNSCILHDPTPTKDRTLFWLEVEKILESDTKIDSFDGVVFPTKASFCNREFTKSISFHGAKFYDGADFSGASFQGRVTLFTDCRFEGRKVDFTEVKFLGNRVSFAGASFETDHVQFDRSEWAAKEIDYSNCQCVASYGLSFSAIKMTGEKVRFRAAFFRSAAIDFRDVEFAASEVDFTECRIDTRLLSFENAVHSKGVVRLTKSVFRAEECHLTGSRWNGVELLLSRADWTIDLLYAQGIRMGLSRRLDLHGCYIRSESIFLQESACLTPRLELDGASFIVRETFHLERIEWECEWVGRGTHIEAKRICVDGAQLSGECLELVMASIRAVQLHVRNASIHSGRFSLSNSRIEAGELDWNQTQFYGHHINFHRLQWIGNTFVMLNLMIRAKRFSFNHAFLQGKLFQMENVDLQGCRMSFWETDFSDTKVTLADIRGENAEVSLRADLKNVDFLGGNRVDFDFRDSQWLDEGWFKRPMLAMEKTAKTTEELAACESTYLWIAHQLERFKDTRRAGDFYYAAYECRRKQLAREGRTVDRWKMEALKWGLGYRLSASRHRPLSLIVGIYSSLSALLTRWLAGHRV